MDTDLHARGGAPAGRRPFTAPAARSTAATPQRPSVGKHRDSRTSGTPPASLHRMLSSRKLAFGALTLTLLFLAAASTARLVGHVADPPSASAPVAGVATIDPRFVIHPHVVTHEVEAGRLRLSLTVSPVIPGTNQLTLTVTDNGRPVPDARVHLMATMLGMRMTPLSYSARETAAHTGRYTATASLSMFGSWMLAVRVDSSGGAPVTSIFRVDISLPPALLQAVPTRDATA
jgi:hypothetical protein